MPDPHKIKTALISVWDKTGIVDFARALHGEFGIEIISTGGTAKTLRAAGIPVTLIEEITGFPEMLDGRVKTLHPAIHAGILADRDNPEHMRQLAAAGIKPIDMVVVNLYPFEKTVADPSCTFEQAIEMIDIGGVTLLRAAAKNHKDVLVLTSVYWREDVLEQIRSGPAEQRLRRSSAVQAFQLTCEYDARIYEWLARTHPDLGKPLILSAHVGDKLRYGENPHQEAQWLHLARFARHRFEFGWDIHPEHEAAMSFNNYCDSGAAVELVEDIGVAAEKAAFGPARTFACAFIKHQNACGVGVGATPRESYERAYLGDPNAAMGGVLALSFPVDEDFATFLTQTYDNLGRARGVGGFFVEVIVAPRFKLEDEAEAIIYNSKDWGKRVRLITALGLGEERDGPPLYDIRHGPRGFLVQDRDSLGLNEDHWKVVTKRAPTDAELADLRLAWLICKHTKSNAISVVKDGMLIGNGAGQMSRVMSCRIATWLASENGHAGQLAGSVAASDAFFPFSDGPKILIDAGVSALIQPGGSKRDADTIGLCNERGVAMIFTGTRHFKH